VLWAEQQVARRRVKRDGIPPSFPKHGDSWIRDSTPQWRSRYAPAWQPDSGSNMNDEKWHKMWYMNDESRVWDGLAAPSMNIRKAWQMGYRGQNVVVCVLDDGIEWKHPDLRRNYDRKASFDANSNDKDPSARPTKNDENKHGTRCAGQISALGNNRLCVPGIAHEARIGAIRMLDGEVTDTVETVSLSYQTHYIDIYSSSWGPEDDGKTVEGPGRLTQQAFQIGVQSGRVGLGSIYIWASGNGGQKGDNCNTDGYTNSIYTLSVNSVSEFGAVPWYSEPCSSTLAATYSSGEERRERAIITTDLHGRCTESHTGTSASAPIAAGIAALVLSASPSLTWRDMQHLVVRGANPSPYLKSREWLVNGVGRRVSHDFGFGLMDAAAMVSLALNWTRVPEQRTCELWLRTDRGHQLPADVPPNYDRTFRLYSDGCLGTRHRVLYLEHVQAKVSLLASVRGRVQLWLHSPLGTVSQLLTKRKFDQKVTECWREPAKRHFGGQAGFHEWPFMTVHNWGETSNGTWKLRVRCDDCRATLQSWSLLLHGTADLPAHQVMPLVPKPRRAAFSTGDDYGGGVAGADGTGWASRGGGRRETAAAAGAGSSYNKNNNNYYYYGVRYSPAAEVNHGKVQEQSQIDSRQIALAIVCRRRRRCGTFARRCRRRSRVNRVDDSAASNAATAGGGSCCRSGGRRPARGGAVEGWRAAVMGAAGVQADQPDLVVIGEYASGLVVAVAVVRGAEHGGAAALVKRKTDIAAAEVAGIVVSRGGRGGSSGRGPSLRRGALIDWAGQRAGYSVQVAFETAIERRPGDATVDAEDFPVDCGRDGHAVETPIDRLPHLPVPEAQQFRYSDITYSFDRLFKLISTLSMDGLDENGPQRYTDYSMLHLVNCTKDSEHYQNDAKLKWVVGGFNSLQIVLTIMGVVLNTLSYRLLGSGDNGSSGCVEPSELTQLLKYLAVSDTAYVLMNFLDNCCHTVQMIGGGKSETIYKLMAYGHPPVWGLRVSMVTVHNWMMLLLAASRVLRVYAPIRSRALQLRQRLIPLTVCIWLLSLALGLPRFLEVTTLLGHDCDKTTGYFARIVATRLIPVYTAIANFGLQVGGPLILTMVCNAVTIAGVIRSGRELKAASCFAGNETGADQQRRTERRNQQASRTVLMLTNLYIACQLPQLVWGFVTLSSLSPQVYITLTLISNSLSSLDGSCNFFVYALSNPGFKRSLERIQLCNNNRQDRRGTSSKSRRSSPSSANRLLHRREQQQQQQQQQLQDRYSLLCCPSLNNNNNSARSLILMTTEERQQQRSDANHIVDINYDDDDEDVRLADNEEARDAIKLLPLNLDGQCSVSIVHDRNMYRQRSSAGVLPWGVDGSIAA
uniref:P/Homo B domain-containing protein n=1 Tax=Macrostomum lignano TaxID=282301 RepID=A0A1I8I1N8_9PLAT